LDLQLMRRLFFN